MEREVLLEVGRQGHPEVIAAEREVLLEVGHQGHREVMAAEAHKPDTLSFHRFNHLPILRMVLQAALMAVLLRHPHRRHLCLMEVLLPHTAHPLPVIPGVKQVQLILVLILPQHNLTQRLPNTSLHQNFTMHLHQTHCP